ncbi:MAG TPA: Uma2 family endonuclease [Polyangiaceae bacterium]
MAAISATPSAERLTFEAWGLLPTEESGELVDGRVVEEEVATIIHETIVSVLNALLRLWLGGRGLVGGSNAKFKVSSRRGRKPDLYVYLPGTRLPRGDARVVELPPDIFIEVVSSARSDQRRDRIEKLSEYAAFGVRYYWLVDPELRSFEILELGGDGRYVHAETASNGAIQTVPGCAGLVIDVDALWREVDRLLVP